MAQSLQTTAFEQLAVRDPGAFLDWLEKKPDSSAPPGALLAALEFVAASDAPRAIEWTRRHAPAASRAPLLAGVFQTWLKSDRADALTFLGSLPAGHERDAMIAQLVGYDVATEDPFFAANMLPDSFEQALHFSDGAGRLDLLRRVLGRMSELDIPAASSLSHRSLKPADREALLKKP